MDDIDVLTELELLKPARRLVRSIYHIVRLDEHPDAVSSDSFHHGLQEALREDPDLIHLGKTHGGSVGEHAPFVGVAVEGPFSDQDGFFLKVRVEFGPGLLDRVLIEEVIEDNVKAEMSLVFKKKQ